MHFQIFILQIFRLSQLGQSPSFLRMLDGSTIPPDQQIYNNLKILSSWSQEIIPQVLFQDIMECLCPKASFVMSARVDYFFSKFKKFSQKPPWYYGLCPWWSCSMKKNRNGDLGVEMSGSEREAEKATNTLLKIESLDVWTKS